MSLTELHTQVLNELESEKQLLQKITNWERKLVTRGRVSALITVKQKIQEQMKKEEKVEKQ